MISTTLLFRQVNPSWVQQGRITSQVFKPTPKDDKQLSVYDGTKISAEASWKHFSEKMGFSSAGVMAVTVGECESLKLPVEPEPVLFPEHVLIKFGNDSNSQIEKKSKILKRHAEDRGWQYLGMMGE